MYSKFNCDISDDLYGRNINRYYDAGHRIYEHFQKQSRGCLKAFLLDNGHIDGTALQNHWFGSIYADVFISHSHQDIEKVMVFAGWLKDKFDLTVFIDSCIWGYCDDLLKQIDDDYCKLADRKTYDYKLRNYTTSHVHTMLSAALLDMIDRTECLIFYNTPQSIIIEDELESVKNSDKTLSPWIYSELFATNVLRQQVPSRLKRLHESFEHRGMNRFNDSNLPFFEYDVNAPLEDMIKLDDTLFTIWANQYNSKEHPLDVLYRIVSRK